MAVRETAIPAVTSVRYLGGVRLALRFADGVAGTLDLAKFGPLPGLLRALRNPAFVAQVRVSRIEGTITWPNGAALDPLILHCHVRGVSVPTYGPAGARPSRGSRHASLKRRPRQRPTGS